MDNKIQECTHKVPENPYGIFAMHCIDNQPLSAEELSQIIAGSVAGVEPQLQEELAKPIAGVATFKI
jgi:hypothetical protein